MSTYHIEYIIHLDIEADNQDRALELGSEYLYDSDCLFDHCEFLAINENDDDDEENDDDDEVTE